MVSTFNNRLRQIILLLVIILLTGLLLKELYVFLPGFLGAVTTYILVRKFYQKLTVGKKWHKGLTALLVIITAVVVIGLFVYLLFLLISSKIHNVFHNQQEVIQGLQIFSDKVEATLGTRIFTDENTKSIATKVSSFVPTLLNSTANLLTNLIILFFLLYYLLVNGQVIERYLHKMIPLKPANVDLLSQETVAMIKANALGIPIICMVQGIFAAIGYLIFGIKDWALWGFVTGVLAFFPLVGTMIVWVPLVIFLYSTGDNYTATWLMLYSIIVTGNVDYITRLGLMKKMVNVHPMITVFGVIVGLSLFGFMGLIFGPLLLSYVIILIKIYINEFAGNHADENKNLQKDEGF